MKAWKWVLGSAVVILAVAAMTAVAGNPILYYVDILSALCLAIFTLPVLTGIHGWRGYWDSFRLPFRPEPASKSDYLAAAAVMDSSIRMLYIAALLGTMIATIGILAAIHRAPDAAEAAGEVVNYAVALITLFYAMIIHLAVLEPMRSRLRRLAAEAENREA